MKYDLLIVACMTLIMLFAMSSAAYSHENAHKVIFNYFGVESHIEVYAFGLAGGMTFPDTNFKTTEARDSAYTAHGINEAVGYPMFHLMFGVMGILIMGFFYIGTKIKD